MKIEDILTRNVEEIIDKERLVSLLKSGKQLRIKYGVDVTNPLLHLGHAVNLWKMREFQELGHKVVFLIGDFTTLIGDPTGKSETRPLISKRQIEKDAKKYLFQAHKILLKDPQVFEVRRNSEWYNKMKLDEFLRLASFVTNAQLIKRDMFQKRIKEGKEIHQHEIVYPILQGYDSVMLNSDLTIIGSDQLFNELMGRFYQEKFGQKPQAIVTTVITPGIYGTEKQSKSIGNYIAILDSPKEKFGKIMSIPDSLITQYFKVYTKLSLKEIEKNKNLLPREAKSRLAREIVSLYHGKKEAKTAEQEFNRVFTEKKLPSKISQAKIQKGDYLLPELLFKFKLATSKGEAKRLIEQGAVEINNQVVKDWKTTFKLEKSVVLKVGKRRFQGLTII